MRKGHVSQSFTFARKSPRLRVLAYLQPVCRESTEEPIGYTVVLETGQQHVVFSHDDLIILMVQEHLDVYIKDIYGRHGYLWLNEALDKKGCTAFLAESSKQLVSLSIKYKLDKRAYTVKIISTRSWEYDCVLDIEFLHTLRRVFDLYGYGVHPSPGSLGYEAMSQHHKSQGFEPINRPSAMLRQRIFKYSSGGRADDFH